MTPEIAERNLMVPTRMLHRKAASRRKILHSEIRKELEIRGRRKRADAERRNRSGSRIVC